MSLKDVLEPAIQMADGYPIEQQLAGTIEREKARIKEWPYSKAVFLTHLGEAREAPEAGEIFRQPDLAATLRKLVETEQQALKAGKSRKDAIMAAYDRFYNGDIAQELVRSTQEQGGLITMADLAGWKVHLEEPVMTTYKGIEVYKLTTWVQGPAMLQALNILEHTDVKAMGYNSPRYMHTIYQAMSLAFADRDFYYGDPYVPPVEPIKGLLSKEYAKARFGAIDWDKNDPDVKPGDPYPFQGGDEPVRGAARDVDVEEGPQGRGARARHPHRRRGLLRRDDVGAGGRRRGVGRVGDAERRLGAGRHRGEDRHRPEPADAGVRARRGRLPVQRRAARPAAALDADAEPRPEGRRALPGLLGAGRRQPGPEPAAVLPEHGRVRHERAAGLRGAEHQQLPDAEHLRPAPVGARPHARGRVHAARRAQGSCRRWATR